MLRDHIDILMITYNRPQYTRLALSRLLETCDEQMRVWVWHNGDDEETLYAVKSFQSHPRLHRFHHSPENVKLIRPTNWLWSNADGEFFSKVDDDSLMPHGWGETLRQAHRDNPRFGSICCWRFPKEDFQADLALRKLRHFPGGHRLIKHPWVEGSGYVMKRRCVEQHGLLQEGQPYPGYCLQLAWDGWVNGWYYPFLEADHMDDPRSKHTLIRTDEDMARFAPLTAAKNKTLTVREWQALIQKTARQIQGARTEPCRFFAARRWAKRLLRPRRQVTAPLQPAVVAPTA